MTAQGLFRPTHEIRVEGRRMPVMAIGEGYITFQEWLSGSAPAWRVLDDGTVTFLGRAPQGFAYSIRELGMVIP